MRDAFNSKGRPEPDPIYQYLAEVVGTFLLCWFGYMAIANAFMGGGSSITLFHIVAAWGFGVAIAIYAIGGISGAHINPCVTIGLWASGRFEGKKVVPYIVAQMLGAFLAAFVTWLFWHGLWDPNGPTAAFSQIWCCHYPNPAMFPQAYPEAVGGAAVDAGAALAWANAHWPVWLGMVIEFTVTFFLLFTIVTVTDPDSPGFSTWFAGMIIALYVMFACFITPMTMTSMNIARDFASRIFAWLLGYGSIVLPGYRWEVIVVYIIPDILGCIAGPLFYDKALKPYLKQYKMKVLAEKSEETGLSA